MFAVGMLVSSFSKLLASYRSTIQLLTSTGSVISGVILIVADLTSAIFEEKFKIHKIGQQE